MRQPPRPKPLLCALLALGVLSCRPADQSGTIQAYVYAPDPASGSYGVRKLPVDNLESLHELRGRDVALRSGSSLFVGLRDLEVDRGGAFGFDYSVDEDGTVVPADLHSFYGLTLYRHLDRAAVMLRAHGHVPLRRLDVLYFPRIDSTLLGDLRASMTDNAGYASVVPGFVIVPSFLLDNLPMLLNEGVVAHEFGHSLVHESLFGAEAQEPDVGDEKAPLHLQVLHEGVADLVGFAVSGDPDFIAPTVKTDRNLAEPRDFTYADLAEFEDPPDEFDAHTHGSTLARVVYEVWPRDQARFSAGDRARLLAALVRALRTLRFGPAFTFAELPNALVAELAPQEKPPACAVLRARLAPLAATLPAGGGT